MNKLQYRAAVVCALTLLAGAAAGCDMQGETIGFRGGEVVSRDGRFALEIPRGALDHEVEIGIEEVDCDVAVVGTCYQVHPVGTAFLKPALATFEVGGMEASPDALALAVERDSDWNRLADRNVDLDDEIVTASAMYLSAFAVISIE